MIWEASGRADPRARELADRHYSRKTIGAVQFAPPGRCCVFYAKTETGRAFWVTSYPYAEYVQHDWAGAWLCAAFRNEGAGIASEMIIDAVAATRAYFGEPPELGMITFINTRKVRPTYVRGRPTWGRTYTLAGFREVGKTKNGLLVFQLFPEDMPAARAAIRRNEQLTVFDYIDRDAYA